MFRTSAILVAVLVPFVASTGDVNAISGERNVPFDSADAAGFPGPWVADMFYQALANFTVQEDAAAPDCREQTRLYVRHLRNNTYWAVKMSDSWNRYPNGILVGSTNHIGVYDECVEVHEPVQGKFCISEILLETAKTGASDLIQREKVENFDDAWYEILGMADVDDRYPRKEFKFGICIPESCTARDLEVSLQNRFNSVFLSHRVRPRVTVDSNFCNTDKYQRPYDVGYYMTNAFCLLILLICTAVTLYHLIVLTRNKDSESTIDIPKYVEWFSIVHNGRDLIKYDKNNNLNFFNGLKVVMLVNIMFGHKFLYFMGNSLTYLKDVEKIYSEGPAQLLACMNMVDPFFFITGFLLYHLMKPQFMKKGFNWTRIPKIIVYKYMRMLPPIVVMILLTTYSVPYWGSGAFWEGRMRLEAENCKNNWWTTIIGISNFVEVDSQCLVVGWYSSCILQFVIIGSVVVYVCAKNRKIGVGLLCVLLCASAVVPFVLTYATRSYGIVRVLIPFFRKKSSSYEFSNLYMPFYMRCIPFFAGLTACVVIEEMKKKGIKLSTPTVYVLTVVTTYVCLRVQFYAAVFYDKHRPYDVFEQAVYATLSHCVWPVLLFCVTVCYFTTGYGPIEKIFTNRIMVPLGRLSYAVYLVNITVIMMVDNRQRTPSTPSIDMMLDGWILTVFRSYFVGALFYLLFEAPFSSIIKQIFLGSANSSGKREEHVDRRISDIQNIQEDSSRL